MSRHGVRHHSPKYHRDPSLREIYEGLNEEERKLSNERCLAMFGITTEQMIERGEKQRNELFWGAAGIWIVIGAIVLVFYCLIGFMRITAL